MKPQRRRERGGAPRPADLQATFFEDWRRNHVVGREFGVLNAPEVIDGYQAPPSGPGWGVEWDWDLFKGRTVAEL